MADVEGNQGKYFCSLDIHNNLCKFHIPFDPWVLLYTEETHDKTHRCNEYPLQPRGCPQGPCRCSRRRRWDRLSHAFVAGTCSGMDGWDAKETKSEIGVTNRYSCGPNLIHTLDLLFLPCSIRVELTFLSKVFTHDYCCSLSLQGSYRRTPRQGLRHSRQLEPTVRHVMLVCGTPTLRYVTLGLIYKVERQVM